MNTSLHVPDVSHASMRQKDSCMNIYFQVFFIYGESHNLPVAREATLSSTPGQDTMFKTEVKMHDAAIRVEGDFCRAASRLSDITHKSKENHWVSPLWVVIGWQLIKNWYYLSCWQSSF